MAKVIVERPRLGGGVNFPRACDRGFRRADIADGPRREGMRRPWIYTNMNKGLNEYLAPLRRFLLSNVGRPWNKVFSEISEHLSLDSAVQLHIWQHIQWEVCLKATRRGKVYFDTRGLVAHEAFVVDARSGLLRKNEQSHRWRHHHYRRRSQPTPSPNFVAGVRGRCYRRIEGIWYEFELAPIPSETRGLFDLVLKRKLSEVRREELIRIHGGPVYAVSKRQLNSKEIRRLKLVS
jgi:hypothetical protein